MRNSLMPVSSQLGEKIPAFLGVLFKGPLDHYVYFWIAQSIIFTLIFLSVFVLFSVILRRLDHAIHSRTIQNQSR